MILETVDFVSAPVASVFDAYTDHERMEMLARARRAEVARGGDAADGPLGLVWNVRAPFRGRMWEAELRIKEIESPRKVVVVSSGGAFTGAMTVLFEETGEAATRVTTRVEVTGVTVPAKMLVSTLALAHGEISRRFAARMAGFAASVSRQLSSQQRRGA